MKENDSSHVMFPRGRGVLRLTVLEQRLTFLPAVAVVLMQIRILLMGPESPRSDWECLMLEAGGGILTMYTFMAGASIPFCR